MNGLMIEPIVVENHLETLSEKQLKRRDNLLARKRIIIAIEDNPNHSIIQKLTVQHCDDLLKIMIPRADRNPDNKRVVDACKAVNKRLESLMAL